MAIGRLTRSASVVLGLAVLCVPAPLQAQDDFLFGRPLITVSLYGGWSAPAEASDLFTETRRELTVREGDFSSPLGLAEVAYRVTEQVDVALAVSRSARTVDSEMRSFRWYEENVEWDDLEPIRQSTRFSRTRLLASGKYYLMPRGREISQFAWVPERWTPYVGAGAGASWYDFSQNGDFAVQLGEDPNDRDIVELALESSDRGLTALALGGVQVSLSPRFLARAEYRYIWGSGELDARTFDGFDPIDLSGSNVIVGISMRL